MRDGTVLPNGAEIKRHRIERGWSQEKLASATGLSKKTIENAESNKPAYGDTLKRIAAAFGPDVRVADLLDGHAANAASSQENVADELPTFRIRGNAPSLGRQLIGRDSDVVEVKRRLRQAISGETVGVVVVRGVPGVGKSALLSRLAQDGSLGEMFPDGGLWAAVGDSPDLNQLLRSWGQVCRIPAGQLMQINDVVGGLRSKLQGRRVLLIVDDVWRDAQAECFRAAGLGQWCSTRRGLRIWPTGLRPLRIRFTFFAAWTPHMVLNYWHR